MDQLLGPGRSITPRVRISTCLVTARGGVGRRREQFVAQARAADGAVRPGSEIHRHSATGGTQGYRVARPSSRRREAKLAVLVQTVKLAV